MWVGDGVLSFLLICSDSSQLQVWQEHPPPTLQGLHPCNLTQCETHAVVSFSTFSLGGARSCIWSTVLEPLTGFWNISQGAGTSLLLCGSICSAAGLADDKWHLGCGLLEQKKVVSRDKLHQGSLDLKGALRVGHSLTKCYGST